MPAVSFEQWLDAFLSAGVAHGLPVETAREVYDFVRRAFRRSVSRNPRWAYVAPEVRFDLVLDLKEEAMRRVGWDEATQTVRGEPWVKPMERVFREMEITMV